ncbi:MAG: hypothetical protein ACMXYF_03740 [Candidatus Woesearchaeota archaeon]
MKTKAELSLSIVVMAVVALLVLVILSYVVLSGSGNFREGVSNCNTVCTNSVAECRLEGYESGVPMTCSIEANMQGSYCCVLPTG